MGIKFTIPDKNGSNRMVGEMNDNGYFLKKVSRKKHFMRKYNSFAISEKIVDKLRGLNCKGIGIIELDNSELWHVTFKEFMENSFLDSAGGYEIQRFLPASYWNIKK